MEIKRKRREKGEKGWKEEGKTRGRIKRGKDIKWKDRQLR
jgi:hypothetical protein